jgi:hypothetical protein
LIAVVLVGVTLAVLSGFFVLQRHRRLMEGYGRIEEQMAERNRELDRAKAEILHSQKMKALGTLAAGIAHDFNNLLSVIRMSNKLIGRVTQVSAEVQENVAEIELAVQQGKHVVHSMLGYSREERETRGPFAVAEVVEDTLALLTKQFLSGIRLTLELAPDTPKVSVSRGRIEQIILNLVVNAAEAMQGNGNLRLSVKRATPLAEEFVLRPRNASRYVEFTVSDSGPGIDSVIHDRIFEPFFTTKNTSSSPGTGLGLSMVYSIAEQDGLGITLETAPGLGATFRITIPVD